MSNNYGWNKQLDGRADYGNWERLAYDENLIGISPDYEILISEKNRRKIYKGS